MSATAAPVNIRDITDRLMALVGVDKNYVERIVIEPSEVTYYLFKGEDGFCKGSKYVDPDTGEGAREEPVTLSVLT